MFCRDPQLARNTLAAVVSGPGANVYNMLQPGPRGQFGERAMAQMMRRRRAY